jgi:phospholipid/cholesterol/gamma-HCH transport system permease protein
MNSFLAQLGEAVIRTCEETGEMLVLFAQSLRECRYAGRNPRRVFVQMKRIGNDTLFIAAAIALFIGMVLGLHSGYTLRRFDFTEALASIVALSMVKEMGPVITGLLLAGRVGASITAEIGTMRVNEEIDALHTLGISPVRYLAMPRFIACFIMLPVLVVYAGIVGILGGGAVASTYFDIGMRSYLDMAFDSMEFRDVAEGLIKAVVFGAIVAVVACRSGFRTRGGAEGVGKAITSAVVTSFICIIISDYFITRFMM